MTEHEPAAEGAETKWFRAKVYMPGLGTFPAEVAPQPASERPAPRFTPAVMAELARAWHRMHQRYARQGVPEAVWDLAFSHGEIVVRDYDFPDREQATPYTETRIGIEDDGCYHLGGGYLPWALLPAPWPAKARDLARILADTEARALHAAFLAAPDTPYTGEREEAYRRLAYTLLALGAPIPSLPEAIDALDAAATPLPAPASIPSDEKEARDDL